MRSINLYRSLLQDKLEKRMQINDESILSYAGSLGPLWGLINVCDAAKILERRNINNIKFIFLGEGDDKN